MEFNASQIVFNNQLQKNNVRVMSASPMPNHRTAHAKSAYYGINQRNKIMPKHQSMKKSQDRQSQSTYVKKNKYQTAARFKKLDHSLGEGFISNNPLKDYKRQTLRRKVRDNLTIKEEGLRAFYTKVEELQNQYSMLCQNAQFSQAAQVVVRLLNYAVDFDLPEQLLRALKILADIYMLTDNLKMALFYFDQTREGALLTQHSLLLVESLLGMAECCSRCGIENEGIKILKKALQYTWMHHLEELELRIYDEIGRMHYHLGQIQKAKQYHTRHINAIHEPIYSALRLLSAQRVTKNQQINLEMRYHEISLLLLVHLKVPIKNVIDLPLPYKTSADSDPVRSHFDISNKYFIGQDVHTAIKNLMNNNWFFKQQIEDPSLPERPESPKNQKFAFLNFQLNKQLRRLEGSVVKPRQKMNARNQFPVKESLEEKIARKIKEPPLEIDWYEKILRQINRDHRNKLLNVRDAVRIRGFNKKTVPQVEAMRDLYNGFFQRWRPFGGRKQN